MAEYHSCYNCIYFADAVDEKGNPKCKYKEKNPKDFIITSQPTCSITNSCKYFLSRWTAIQIVESYNELKENIQKVKGSITGKKMAYNSKWSLIDKAVRNTCDFCLKTIDSYLGDLLWR